MSIALKRADFDAATAFALSAAAKTDARKSVPILGTVGMRVNGRAEFIGTDLDVTATASIDFDGEPFDTAIMAPANVRQSVVRSGGEIVSIGEGKDGALTLESGRLKIEGRSLPFSDFPVEEPGDYAFAATVADNFIDMLSRVSAAASTEEVRYYLNGIYMHHVADWTYRLAATDGHRLYFADVQLPDAEGIARADRNDKGFIIPTKAVKLAIKHFARTRDPVRLTVGAKRESNKRPPRLDDSITGTRITLSSANNRIARQLTTKLIDGTFPDYSRVIPTANDKPLTVKRAELRQAVQAVAGFGSEKTRAVRLELVAGGVTVSLHSPENGKAAMTIDGNHSATGFYIGFNGQYLIDILDRLTGEDVLFEFSDRSAPTMIHNPADADFRVVLMPMRV
jgi:DNA polymerase III subunit beta